MMFINITPAWDWNEPVRTVCIEPKFTLGYRYDGIRLKFQILIRYKSHYE